MKRSLCAFFLIIWILSLWGCTAQPSEVPTEPSAAEVTEPETTVPETTAPLTEAPTVPTTEAPKEPLTEAPTEPATEAPTEPITEAPTKPTESTKPSQNTKPIKPTVPTEPVTEAPTKPEPTTKPQDPSVSQEGWVDLNGKRYYLNADGSYHTGWLKLDGDRYYFLEDGTMAVGKVNVPGEGKRYFTSTGKEFILVNPWNYVPEDYSVKLSTYGDYKVAKHCLDDLKEMLADCKSAGSKAVVVSAYRSHSYQEGLFQRRIQRFLDQGYSQEEAEREAAKRVAVPGTSEHELGLAVDIVDVNYQNLDKKQEETAAQQWLMANSWKYGFILRYPNEKSDVTGIIYEPWHYRYVGKELAQELHDCGLCLEEYFSSLTN